MVRRWLKEEKEGWFAKRRVTLCACVSTARRRRRKRRMLEVITVLIFFAIVETVERQCDVWDFERFVRK